VCLLSLALASMTAPCRAVVVVGGECETTVPVHLGDYDDEGNPIFFPFCLQPSEYDLGDITSQGMTGLALRVEPSGQFLHDQHWKHYDPFGEPPIAPAQGSIVLPAGEPLTAIIPHLAHLPTAAWIQTSIHHEGNDLFVEASRRMFSVQTATYYGPHEYLLPIGALPIGDYKLHYRQVDTDDWSDGEFTREGIIRFTVVPEPGTLALAGVCALLMCAAVRKCRPVK
jgi:hypothetical protein